MSERAGLRRQRCARMLLNFCSSVVGARVEFCHVSISPTDAMAAVPVDDAGESFVVLSPHQEAQLRLYLEAGRGVFLTYHTFFIEQAHCVGCPLSARGPGKCAWNCRKQAANHQKTLVAARCVQTLGCRIPKRCPFPNDFLAILRTCDERAALVARSLWCQAYSRVLREILEDTYTPQGKRRSRAARARR